jgi:hypothetical protein
MCTSASKLYIRSINKAVCTSLPKFYQKHSLSCVQLQASYICSIIQRNKTVYSSLAKVYPKTLFCTVDCTVRRVKFEYRYGDG